MGLAVSIAGVIIGICYLAYKYCNEELQLSSLKSVGVIVLGIIGLAVLGQLGNGVLWIKYNAEILYLAIITPIAIVGCIVVGWLVVGDVKDAVKDLALPSEVRMNKPSTDTPASAGQPKNIRVLAFRRAWLRKHDEVLRMGDAEKMLNEGGHGIQISQAMLDEEQRISSQSESGNSIIWTEDGSL